MTSQLQAFLCCVLFLVVVVSGRPQVWNIGFSPNDRVNGNRPHGPSGRQNPFIQQVDQNSSSSTTTTAPAVQVTTPSRAYYDCLGRCPSTSEYNPICGSNQISYHNLGRLQCAARCGINVSVVRRGTCSAL